MRKKLKVCVRSRQPLNPGPSCLENVNGYKIPLRNVLPQNVHRYKTSLPKKRPSTKRPPPPLYIIHVFSTTLDIYKLLPSLIKIYFLNYKYNGDSLTLLVIEKLDNTVHVGSRLHVVKIRRQRFLYFYINQIKTCKKRQNMNYYNININIII